MTSRAHDPLRLDMAVLAAEGTELAGRWPGAELTRLAESQTVPQDLQAGAVSWTARGERRPMSGAAPQTWLTLTASTTVWLTCQRCLQPFEAPLAVAQRIRFVRDEAEAETLDAELEDDVLALPRWLDLRSLVEDELLLGLPIVPRHPEVCPRPLVVPGGDDSIEAAARPNPFAALQALKTGRGNPPR
ncbi:MAG: DUF177 domain-containing protein [Burkholderiales bacterium]|nr:DUF177 domain-containing protein [Burkholderiales bacterium]